ncbi:MAG: hypothetical protein HFH68_10180 [Lachnospiraceae bacterium]|nr:hypothetical protein [Lachnospiraceae bacterium]
MKKLFITGIIYICLFILLVAGIFNLGKNFNENISQSDEVAVTAEDITNNSVQNTEVPEENTEKPETGKMEDKVVVKGDISEDVSPFSYNTTADKYLLDLCYASLCNMKDRKCISKNVSNIYDKKADITTFKITLNEEAENASGHKITADDLLFNYYLRADTGYTADGGISAIPVAGMQEYRYGTKNITSVKKKIAKKLKKPDKRTAFLIRKHIIRPVIEKEYEWVCSLYKQETYDYITDKYPRKKDLFVYFFAYGTDYKTKGKKAEKVINDVIKSYGSDYNKLGKITGENYKKQAEGIALRVIQSDKKFKFRTRNISGIKKLDDYTISIDIKGNRKPGYINKLGSMYIVSMENWGNRALFNGTDQFGFKRGRAGNILKGRKISEDETGNYTIQEITDGVYTLQRRTENN